MFVNDENVEGQEGEVSEEVKETQEVVEEEAAQPEVEVKDPNLVDEEGVPYKNRAKEFERKYYKLLEEKAKETPDAEHEEAPELTPEEQAIADVVSKREKIQSKALNVIDSVLADLDATFPGKFTDETGEFKRAIVDIMKNMNDADKLKPQVVQNIAMMNLGMRVAAEQEKKPAIKKLVSQRGSGSEVLNPSAKGGTGSEIQLTEEEEEYASDHRLDSKGFSAEEIRDMYKLSRKKT